MAKKRKEDKQEKEEDLKAHRSRAYGNAQQKKKIEEAENEKKIAKLKISGEREQDFRTDLAIGRRKEMRKGRTEIIKKGRFPF